MSAPVLAIRALEVDYASAGAPAHVVRGVDLDVAAGEAVGLVGESGCGKSTTLLAVLGLLPAGRASVRGSIRFEGAQLVSAGERVLARLRGPGIGAVFQNARGALHPMRTVGDQVARVVRRHSGAGRAAARAEAVRALADAGLPNAAAMAERYPHQLSGGQCQRAMIAAALVSQPRLILADEPTSGLDVTVQEQVLDTLAQRVAESGAALLVVSHDLRVIERTCSRVAVMYAGEIVELGAREEILGSPKHPYTQGLVASRATHDGRLGFIPGSVPDPRLAFSGCSFANRCPHAHEACIAGRPALRRPAGEPRVVRCVLYEGPPARTDVEVEVGAGC
jgi:peptide/nickel transport system ATP-binding protein